MKVYILEGWFGDDDWIEGVYAIKEQAEKACDRLWVNRQSEEYPERNKGLCKFEVVEYIVQ